MEALKEDIYQLRWLAKALPLVGIGGVVYVWITAPRSQGVDGVVILLYAGILSFFAMTAVHFFLNRIVLTEEKVLVRRLIWDKMVPYEEIDTLDLSNPVHPMQVYRASESWPALTIYLGIKGWKKLMFELIKRAPDDVEIIDPYDRLGRAMSEESSGE
jgi:hypothetical protein